MIVQYRYSIHVASIEKGDDSGKGRATLSNLYGYSYDD